MKSHYKFSIIIPAYNPGKKVIRCLKSIEKSIKFFSKKKKIIYEILLINDGGNEINLNFKHRIRNLRQINLKINRGVGYCRQYGTKKSKYDYLFFIDSDIVIKNNTIFTLFKDFELLENIGSIGPIQNYKNYNKDLTSDFVCAKRCYGYEDVKKYLEFSAIRSECCLIKKSFLESVGGWKFFPNAGIEEFELGHRIIKKGKINYLTKNTSYSTFWDNISTRCKNIIFRTSSYLPVFISRKKFETKGSFATLSQALSSLTTLLTLTFIIFFFNIEYFTEFLTILLFINLAVEFDFLKFALMNFKKKNIIMYPLGIFLINISIIIGFLLGTFNIIRSILIRK